MVESDAAERVAHTFKAPADPTRIRILPLLAQGERSVTELAEALELSQSAVSHRFAFLRSIRLVRYRRQGKSLFYSCDDDHVLTLLGQGLAHLAHD
ncbi:metalloregulator ArsR/SmtB family transcription factor [Hydrogenibacillus sp. N12]|uniref:ArsR/SmtB family transcription factor n=1 Tax=Hydrogenibacillus sp. N12 TaxID=2866627 RepID=UPI001C7D2C16|nr:metalloregulator ArsR/SmtB family transcription factor [Hydrogenibacillus sp. N12]QZA34284.1 metalloregulator ArsR/SmtB family transcription factor [Hydrogenibacillus sp. N12]